MKYIIKNCPETFQNIDDNYVCPSVCRQEGFPVYCKNTTNCLLKRIVELCANKYYKDVYKLEDKILNLLEIEEVQ